MATLSAALRLQDQMSAVLNSIASSMYAVLDTFEQMQTQMDAGIEISGVDQVRTQLEGMTTAIQDAEAAMAMSQPSVQASSVSSSPAASPSVQWQSDGLSTFTDSGMDRFRQEVQSANAMLSQLSNTQNAIAKQAYNTNVFPPAMFQDLNSLAVRIDGIKSKIQQIENNPVNMGTARANGELEQLRGQLDQALREQQSLNQAMANMDVSAANSAYMRLSSTVSSTEQYIRDNTTEQGRFNQAIQEGTSQANGLTKMIKGAVAAYASIQSVKQVLNLSDQLASTTARLDLMNDGLQTTQELNDMIYLSAERSRGSYQATADAVSKLGLMAGDAFSSSEEIIAFTEQLNKQFTIAGTSASGIDAAMLQLTQAMGSGVLRGEEYNSILEQAPNIIQSIADYMGVPMGQLKDMAAEGQITAEIVKNAMFAAADETNAKFENMPKTFSQIFASFQNTALMAFQPVLQRLNTLANSEAFQSFVNGAISALSVVAGVVLQIFDLITSVGSLIADNWSWLSPIIYGVAAALGVYYGWLLLTKGAEVISAVATAALTAAKMLAVPVYALLTGATMANTAAQWGLNSAMYSCPLVWIIILIIALIAIIYAVVAAINKFAGTSISATGVICGAFMVAAAFIGNILIAAFNFIIDIFVVLWNFIAAFANFFGNVFDDPVGSIARLFFDLVDTVLSLLQTLASVIDTIFGSNLAGAVQGWRDSLGGWVDDTFGEEKEIMKKLDSNDLHLNRFEYSGAWESGYSFGQGVDESISNFDPSSLFGDLIPDPNEQGNEGSYGNEGYENLGSNVEDIANNTGSIADSMEITEDELKYLRDVAEMETINRFTTAEIKVDMVNHNNVSSNMDIDGMVNRLADQIEGAMENAAEGVHT